VAAGAVKAGSPGSSSSSNSSSKQPSRRSSRARSSPLVTPRRKAAAGALSGAAGVQGSHGRLAAAGVAGAPGGLGARWRLRPGLRGRGNRLRTSSGCILARCRRALLRRWRPATRLCWRIGPAG
jgi:hypothetical protein